MRGNLTFWTKGMSLNAPSCRLGGIKYCSVLLP